jgi:hypothetical protein
LLNLQSKGKLLDDNNIIYKISDLECLKNIDIKEIKVVLEDKIIQKIIQDFKENNITIPFSDFLKLKKVSEYYKADLYKKVELLEEHNIEFDSDSD